MATEKTLNEKFCNWLFCRSFNRLCTRLSYDFDDAIEENERADFPLHLSEDEKPMYDEIMNRASAVECSSRELLHIAHEELRNEIVSVISEGVGVYAKYKGSVVEEKIDCTDGVMDIISSSYNEIFEKGMYRTKPDDWVDRILIGILDEVLG